jgi:hypothetical protein
LGINLANRLPQSALVRSHRKLELQSLFPSTTAAALTTVATGQWPAQHGVLGWWTRLPEFNLTATILPVVERFSHQPLATMGVSADYAFPVRAYHAAMRHEPLSFVPEKLVNTLYSTYSRGGTGGRGYRAIDAAVEQIIQRIHHAPAPTFAYLYIADVDTLAHFRGWDHEDVIALATWLDAHLARIPESLGKKARLIVSADHGQTKVPLRDRLALYDDDPLMKLLVAPPSGNPLTPFFHVHPDQHSAFRDIFQGRYADQLILLSAEEANELRLFGPEPLSDTARRRLGDFLAIPLRPITLKHYERGTVPASDDLGSHSGLTPDEMWVPLVIA